MNALHLFILFFEKEFSMAINVKQIIADAIIELTEEKPLAKITVSNIIERAGTGRQTFYNHFKDKNDLIYWIFCRTLIGERELISKADYFSYLENLYNEAQKYRNFLKQACALDGQNSLSEAIYTRTYRYYKSYIVKNYGNEVLTDELEYALQFNAYGASNTYILWTKAGMPGTGTEQARYALRCMPPIIRQYLPLKQQVI